MPRGGVRKTTWKKGEKPPVKKPKGAKNKRTVLKESLGLKNWDELKVYIETNGIEKCIKELSRLRGAKFVNAFLSLTEYVKPKMSRVEAVGDPEKPLQVASTENLTFEQLYELKYGHPPKA